MTLYQLIIFFSIIFLSVLKSISFKKCSNEICPFQITLFLSFILMISTFIILPKYIDNFVYDLKNNTLGLLIPVAKGVLFFAYIYFGNVLSKISGSSRIIAPIVGVGLIALINYSLLNENLNNYQITSSILITLLGVIYYLKGHISEVKNAKFIFFKFLSLVVILSVLDHWGNSTIHWYSYLLISTTLLYLMNFFFSKKRIKLTIKDVFNKKILLVSCLIYVFMEIFITSVRVNEIPVTMINIAVLMSSPITMIYMNIFYKESTINKQLFFGLLAFFIGLISLI